MSKKLDDNAVSFCSGPLPDASGAVKLPSDPLEADLLRITLAHPDLQLGFRREELSGLNESTKLQLLKDVKLLLKISEINVNASL